MSLNQIQKTNNEETDLEPEFIIPDWPARSNIRAISTTRLGGVSKSPYNSFNIASHVEDKIINVTENRRLLKEYGKLPSEPVWLQQIHGAKITNADNQSADVVADGNVCDQANIICLVQTADCLPLLVTNTKGDKVGALHAGWRGMVSGIIENGIVAMSSEPDQILIWMGPAIGPEYFEIGEDVYQAFDQKYPNCKRIFSDSGNGKWQLDIYKAATMILKRCGVSRIYGGDYCTYSESERFFSYRRDNVCGRMASMIWMEE